MTASSCSKKRMGWANSWTNLTKHNGYVQKWGPKSTAIIIIMSYFPFIFKKRYSMSHFETRARVFCTETLPNFLHHWRRRSSSPGRNVFHMCPCYKEQDMHQWHQHVQRHATLCCIVSTQNTSWDLLRFAFSTGSSSFVLKNTEFQSATCFRHLCAREWLKKMCKSHSDLVKPLQPIVSFVESKGSFQATLQLVRCLGASVGSGLEKTDQGTEKAFATNLLDKTELWEYKIWNETVRKLTSLLVVFTGIRSVPSGHNPVKRR